MNWKLEGCGGRPMKAASAYWSRQEGIGTQFAYAEIEFGGVVREISVRPRDNGTVEVRGHGPNYAACKVLRPPGTTRPRSRQQAGNRIAVRTGIDEAASVG